MSENSLGEVAIWGFHMGIQHGTAPINSGYVTIGWPEMANPSSLNPDRESFKAKYAQVVPQAKVGAVRVAAGQVFRFYHEMKVGDLIVFLRSMTGRSTSARSLKRRLPSEPLG